MKRYPAFDPPEYVDWELDEDVLAQYRRRLEDAPERREIVEGLSTDELLDLYRGLVRFRLHDIALQRWVKQGVISKAWLGTGEEAVTVGAVHALRRDGRDGDVVGPMIRNAGACHEMGIPVADMLRGYLASEDSPTRGRDLHIGDLERGVQAPISMVGALAPVMNGFAWGFRRRGENRIALTWVGDGATKHGEVHEALNFAAVRELPVVFVLQNNQVALGTRFGQHHPGDSFEGWGRAYGAALMGADGNHVLDVYAAAALARRRCVAGEGPVFLAVETFRMGGHATHDVREARETFPAELFERWGKRDPIGLYEAWLERGVEGVDRERLGAVEEEVRGEVRTAAREARESRRHRMPDPGREPELAADGVYA